MVYTFLYRNNFCLGRLEERDIYASSLLEAAAILDNMFVGFADIIDVTIAE